MKCCKKTTQEPTIMQLGSISKILQTINLQPLCSQNFDFYKLANRKHLRLGIVKFTPNFKL